MIEFDFDELQAAAHRLGTGFRDHESEEIYALAKWMSAQVDDFLEVTAPLQPAPSVVPAVRSSGAEATTETDPLNAVVRWVDIEALDEEKTSGILDGKRFGFKDLISVAGVPLSAAGAIFDGFTPREDAPVTQRVLRAGGRIVAMTNLEGMAWGGGSESGRWGAVSNPHDPSKSTAGSSGGSGASLFYDGVDITLGTDQGGSIRLPASWCGVLGLKPTWSLVPYTGIASHEFTFDHVGPMTRTAEDMALAMAALAGPCVEDPRQDSTVPADLPFVAAVEDAPADYTGVTFGVLTEALGYSDGSPEREGALAAFQTTLDRIRELGGTVVEVSIPEHLVGGSIIFGAMVESVAATLWAFGDGYHWSGAHSVDTRLAVGKGLKAWGDELPVAYRTSAALGELLRSRYFGTVYAKAQNAIPRVRDAYDAALAEVDVLIMPTTPTTAMERRPDAGIYEKQTRSFSMAVDTATHNATGHPALSIPAAEVDGMPLGIMLVGKHFHDHERGGAPAGGGARRGGRPPPPGFRNAPPRGRGGRMEHVTLAADHPLADGRTASAPLIRAYRGDRPAATPVWFMRQAGRSLPEYRELRVGTEMLEACLNPELASEITLQPVRRHGVDAAIFFSDIVVPVKLAGVGVEIVPGRGPVLDSPIRSASDVLMLRPLDPDALAPIREAVARTVAELGSTPLIGFAGAPFTLASYLVEGGPSKDQLRARGMMYSDPHSWATLLNWCADVAGQFLLAQVEAGASAVQLFDSWVGSLSRRDYQRRIAPHSKRAFDALRGVQTADGVSPPRVHFGLGGGEFLDLMRDVGADTVGVDWRLPLDVANERLGGTTAVQGNIDPALLSAPWSTLRSHLDDVLDRGAAAPAHVLNLGHGVPPETDPDVLTRIVEHVHDRV